jgi:MFS family permease
VRRGTLRPRAANRDARPIFGAVRGSARRGTSRPSAGDRDTRPIVGAGGGSARRGTVHPRVGDRDTRLIVGAVGVSALGDFLLWIPLTLHVQRMTGSPLAIAGLMICLWSPIVVLSPVAGVLADRLETRRLLIWASLAQALLAGSLALALGSVAAILALAAMLGVGFAVAQPAEFRPSPASAGWPRSTATWSRRATRG